jgi:hypothetical protein
LYDSSGKSRCGKYPKDFKRMPSVWYWIGATQELKREKVSTSIPPYWGAGLKSINDMMKDKLSAETAS